MPPKNESVSKGKGKSGPRTKVKGTGASTGASINTLNSSTPMTQRDTEAHLPTATGGATHDPTSGYGPLEPTTATATQASNMYYTWPNQFNYQASNPLLLFQP